MPAAGSFLIPAFLAVLGLAVHPLLAGQTRLQSPVSLLAAELVYLGSAGMVALLMLAGGWFLALPDNLNRDVRTAFGRVGLPALVWTTLALLGLLAREGAPPLADALKGVLKGTLVAWNWLPYALFGQLLFLPLLRAFLRGGDRSDLVYILGLWGVTVSLLPLLRVAFNLNIGIELNYMMGFPVCFLLGAVLQQQDWSRSRRAALLLACFLLALIFPLLAYLGGQGALREYLFDPLGVHVLLLAACLVTALRSPSAGFLETAAAALAVRGPGLVLLSGLIIPWLVAGPSLSRSILAGLLAFALAVAVSALLARCWAGRILLLDYPTLGPDAP